MPQFVPVLGYAIGQSLIAMRHEDGNDQFD